MHKPEKIYGSGPVYESWCEYGGIHFRLVSDDLFLKEINFVKKSVLLKKGDMVIPAPVKLCMDFLNAYFSDKSHGRYSVIFRHNWRDTLIFRGSGSAGSIVLDLEGYTEKEVAVYSELIKVRPGECISYGELAARCGIPGGGRFIGNTMAKNRFPVIIPCHRVIKSDGSMGNFSGGVDIKEKLLRHEEGN